MTIATFIDPTQMPSPDDDQIPFDNKMAAVFRNLPQFAVEVNATAANLNSIAAGGAYALPYTFSSSASEVDPGSGKLGLSSSPQTSSVALRVNTTNSAGIDSLSLLNDFGASTSAVTGTVRLVKMGDPSKWLVFNITAAVLYTGYMRLTVVGRGGSSASPFTAGDVLIMFFQRTGDTGSNGSMRLVSQATISSAVANVDFLNVFTSAHDKYVIEVEGLAVSASGNTINFRFANGGAVDSSAAYGFASSSSSNLTMNSTSVGLTNGSQPTSYCMTLEVRNMNSTGVKSASYRGGGANAGLYETTTAEILYSKASTVSGFRLYGAGGGNITAGTVRIYGVLNT